MLYGYRGSPADYEAIRYTKDAEGNLTPTTYKVKTMLTEDGAILATGRTRIQRADGVVEKYAEHLIPFERFTTPQIAGPHSNRFTPDVWAIFYQEIAVLDTLVELATPQRVALALPTLAGEENDANRRLQQTEQAA